MTVAPDRGRRGAVVLGGGFFLLLALAVVAMCTTDPMGFGVVGSSSRRGVVSLATWRPLPTPIELAASRWLGPAQVPMQQVPMQQVPMPQAPLALAPGLWEPAGAGRAVFLRKGPDITVGDISPHEPRGPCVGCHKILPARRVTAVQAGLGSRPSSNRATANVQARARAKLVWTARPDRQATGRGKSRLPWQEAHWQGIEAIPLTRGVARMLKIPSGARGVVIDDVSQPADTAGFQAGDLITMVGATRTPSLDSFVGASERVRDQRTVEVGVMRHGKQIRLRLGAMGDRLGTAAPETAPMIRSGAVAPHSYRGACTSCHRVGTTGQLAADQGDLINRAAPPIRRGQRAPHRMRGKCSNCHVIR